ncbi:MAG: SurA N-terminal domain-containing protein [Gammaproteobacteria bacterium]|nr:SurA N-terminal domain-containing protein [Gammaproteobacteria bacterium]
MLQIIRDRFTGKFALFILALITVPFLFFGVTNYNFLGASYAAKVNDTEISTAELERAFQNQMLQNPQLAEAPVQYHQMIRQSILDQLITQALIDQFLAENGYRVGNEMVTRLVQSTPDFQVEGEFSREKYYEELELRGMLPAQFEQMQRDRIRQSQLQRAIAATAFVTPSEYRRHLNIYGEQREVAIATFELDDIRESIDVSEDEILAFYDDNPDSFQSEESVDIEYIEINREELAQNAGVSAEELEEYYDQVANRYLQDEQRRARHILITFDDDEDAARQQAAAITARIDAGEPFEDLARTYSKDGGTAEQGGELGTVMQSQMPGELGNAIFSMTEGEVRGPVRTEFGYHVIRLDEIVEGGPLPLDRVRDELERELRDARSESRFRELERTLSDALFDLLDMNTMAEQTGLEIRSATNFTRFGGEPFGANQSVIDAVYDQRLIEDGQISDIVEIDATRSALFRVTEHREARRRPLDEVREEIVAAIKSRKAEAIVRERSDVLQAALLSGAEFSQAAADANAKIMPATVTGRDNDDIDSRILEAVFAVKKPTGSTPRVGTAVTQTGDHAVFVVTAAAPGRPEAIPLAERDARKNDLAQDSGIADLNAFLFELERNADITKSESALAEPEF